MKASGTGAKLAGDSRADSPGHCAKFGTYSLLDTTLNKIVDVKLVEAGGQVFLNRLTGASIQHAKSSHLYSCALSNHQPGMTASQPLKRRRQSVKVDVPFLIKHRTCESG